MTPSSGPSEAPMRTEASLPLAQRLWLYQIERFPLRRHGPLIVVFAGAAALYGGSLVEQPVPLPRLVAAVLSSGSFFLLMRLADEVKDRHEDARCRPYRPVPRGLVSLRELVALGLVTALLQLLLVLALTPAALPLLGLTWAWFALMGVEFCCPAWLRAHLLLYTLSHMVIVPLIALLAVAVAVLPAAHVLPWPALLPLLVLCFLNGLAIEFARKIRRPADEEAGVDTWSAHWGLRPALVRWSVVVLLSLPAALAAAQPIGALRSVLLLLLPLLLWIARSVRPWLQSRPGTAPDLALPADPLEWPTALWTLATYLALGWLPALAGGR